MTDKTCEERIGAELKHELSRIREATNAKTQYAMTCLDCGEEWQTGDDTEDCPACRSSEIEVEELECETRESYEQGILSINAQVTIRVQLSTGGPGDEFLIEVDPLDNEITAIRYVFLDWFDRAERRLTGSDFDLVAEMFGWLADEWRHYVGAKR